MQLIQTRHFDARETTAQFETQTKISKLERETKPAILLWMTNLSVLAEVSVCQIDKA